MTHSESALYKRANGNGMMDALAVKIQFLHTLEKWNKKSNVKKKSEQKPNHEQCPLGARSGPPAKKKGKKKKKIPSICRPLAPA